MSKPRLLLTGGSGMVGRNILEHHRVSDWDVIAPSSRELDLTDALSVEKFLSKNKPDLVIHAAGQVGGIQANIADPVGFLERNTKMGLNTIMSSYQAGVCNFLNIASTCMYPRNAQNPLCEEMILTGELEPTNEAYALSKIMATRLCQYIRKIDNRLQYKTIIPCNLFGRFDKFNQEQSHLIPAIIHKIHQAKIFGETKVEIWGDGTARREFMYTGDLADAVLRGAANISSLPDLMNCGLGHDYSINEYYQFVAEAINWQCEFVHDLTKPVGMKQKLCSTKRQVAWGWSAPTPLKEAISSTYEYYLKEVHQ